MRAANKNNTFTPNNIIHMHDRFVRTVMSDLRVARQFFNIHLPAEIIKLIDLECLSLEPRSYIDNLRKENIVDLLYRTTIKNEEAYLYLLVEHQSSPDSLMPFRIFKYMWNVMDHHRKHTKTKKLPLVYPIVIYHAKKPYPYSTDIKELIAAPKILIDKYFLKPFHLLDLGKIDDEELKTHAWVGIMEFVLKHIYARDIVPVLKSMVKSFHQVVHEGGEEYVFTVLQYILMRGEISDEQAFFELIDEEISKDIGETIMTLAERLRAEGIQQGMQQGMQQGKQKNSLEIAMRMLAEGMDINLIAKLTGLEIEHINTLKS